MISRDKLFTTRLRKQLVLAFTALSILVVLFLSQAIVPGPVKARVEKSEGCCGGEDGDNKPHLLAGSYYTLKDNMSAKLLLNNKGPQPIEITPTLFSMNGQRFDAPAVSVAGNDYQFIDLATWVALAGEQFSEGSIQLFHRGKDLVIGAQIYLADEARSLSFEEKLSEPATSKASRLVGTWWLPSPRGTLDLAVSNATDAAVSATASITGENPKRNGKITLELQPHETRIVNVERELLGKEQSAMSRFGALSVEHNGAPGGVLARAMAYDAAVGYSLPIQFSDPKGGKSTSVQGAGVRFGKIGGETLSPLVVAHNAGDSEVRLDGRLNYTMTDGTNGQVHLPQTQLSPGETEVIDVALALAAHNIRRKVSAAGLEFDHNGLPGAVVTSAFSISESGNQVFRVPLWDILAQRSATGGYPWYIEGDSSTVVFIKNVTDDPRQYTLQLRHEGGVYAIGLKTIEPRQTVAIDIRALRDQQVPDESGDTLPLDATRGQVNWSMRGPQNQVLIGRSEQVDLAGGISSNYACQNCCPDSFDGAWVDPGGFDGFVGENMQFTSLEQTVNCYGSSNSPYQMWGSWDSTNWNVLGFCSGAGVGTADGPGMANAQARWLAYEWGSFESGNPNECYERPIDVLAEAVCQIAAGPDHLVVVGDIQGYTTQLPEGGTCPGNYYIRQVRFQVVSSDQNGAAPVGDVIVRETFESVTNNTCGNGQPQASGCQSTINSGTFIDTITTACAGRNGPTNCGYDIDWSWHWCGTVNLPIVKLASLTAQVRRDSVSLNGRSGPWPEGTAFRR